MEKFFMEEFLKEPTGFLCGSHLKRFVFYLDDRRAVYVSVYLLGRSRHVGDGVEVVHLGHRHGYGCRRQPHGQQRVGHHHEGQVQPWVRRRERGESG